MPARDDQRLAKSPTFVEEKQAVRGFSGTGGPGVLFLSFRQDGTPATARTVNRSCIARAIVPQDSHRSPAQQYLSVFDQGPCSVSTSTASDETVRVPTGASTAGHPHTVPLVPASFVFKEHHST